MDLETNMVSKLSQVEKSRTMISLLWDMKQKAINEQTNRNIVFGRGPKVSLDCYRGLRQRLRQREPTPASPFGREQPGKACGK